MSPNKVHSAPQRASLRPQHVALGLILCTCSLMCEPSLSFTTSFIKTTGARASIPSTQRFTVGPIFSSKASSRRRKKISNNNDDEKSRQQQNKKGFAHHHHHHSSTHDSTSTLDHKIDPTKEYDFGPEIHIKDVHSKQNLHLSSSSHHNHHHNKHHLQKATHHNQLHHNNHQHSQQQGHAPNRMSQFLSHIIPPQNNYKLVSETPEWKRLLKHAEQMQNSNNPQQHHLRTLMKDVERCDNMYATTDDGLYLDYSRQRMTLETMDLLLDLAERQNLESKIQDMVNGEKINFTEERAVLHTALRAPKDADPLIVDGVDVHEEVHDVLDQVKYFTDAVRSGKVRGYTGKRLRNIISVGIGGSYLGPEFLHECLKTEPEGINSALGYTLRFLSNVDPVDVERACADLDPEETLVVIVSKTFTTAETMLNARTVRQWLWDFMGNDVEVVKKHIVAVASISSIDRVKAFGIDTDNYFFRFWDWVGGRYSVCSAVGALPVSLLYGYELFEKFLQGARSVDEHFLDTPLRKNIPVIMGLVGVWNMSFLGYSSRATLPYAEALLKLPAHIQQLDMESNGKKATRNGLEVNYPVGEVDFGEPGTNGQHSFYQLLHMGQTVPCEFIGFVESQHDLCIDGESLSSHDELMANFFAQPDALANGKTADEVRAEGVREDLVIHKTFEGNRPSLSLLAPKLTAYSCGQLLAIYEHRTAVQGFLWDINSFDQWGVELGKKLACDVKDHLLDARNSGKEIDTGNPATSRLLNYYVQNSQQKSGFVGFHSNPLTTITRKSHREHTPPSGNNLKGKDGKLL